MFVSTMVPVRTYSPAPMGWAPSLFSAPPALPVAPPMPQVPAFDSREYMMQTADQLLSLLLQLMNPAQPNAGAMPNVDALAAWSEQTQSVQQPAQPKDHPNTNPTVSNSDGLKGRSLGHLGEWGAHDEQFLDKAIQGVANGHGSKQELGGFDAIFSQFGQNNVGNCVSTAVIKAAMDHYEGKVFEQVSKVGDGYKVHLRDGATVQISRAELRQAGKATNYDGKPSEVKSMAVLCYAVIAKREARSRNISMTDAFKDMGNGYNTSTAAKGLGLEGSYKRIKASEIGKYDGVFAHGGHHVVYIDQNHTDHYGKAQGFNNTNTIGDHLDGIWAFTG